MNALRRIDGIKNGYEAFKKRNDELFNPLNAIYN